MEIMDITSILITVGIFLLGIVNAVVGWFIKSWMTEVKDQLKAVGTTIQNIDKKLAVLCVKVDGHDGDLDEVKQWQRDHVGGRNCDHHGHPHGGHD